MPYRNRFIGKCTACEGEGLGPACDHCGHQPDCERCQGSGQVEVQSPFGDADVVEVELRGSRRLGVRRGVWLLCGSEHRYYVGDGLSRYWSAELMLYQEPLGIAAGYKDLPRVFEWLVEHHPEWDPETLKPEALHAEVLASGFEVER